MDPRIVEEWTTKSPEMRYLGGVQFEDKRSLVDVARAFAQLYDEGVGDHDSFVIIPLSSDKLTDIVSRLGYYFLSKQNAAVYNPCINQAAH